MARKHDDSAIKPKTVGEECTKSTIAGKRSKPQPEIYNHEHCVLIHSESRQLFPCAGNRNSDAKTEVIMHRNDSSNTNSAIGYTLDRPISPLHQCDRSCTSDQHQISRAPEHGMISETRNRCRPRSSYRSHRFNSHLFPRSSVVMAMIVAALIMVLPVHLPLADAKKTNPKTKVLLKQYTGKRVSTNKSHYWSNPVLDSLTNFVRPSEKRTTAKVINIDELGAARDVTGTVVDAPVKERKVVQPSKKKKALLLPLPRDEPAETMAQQEGLMGEAEVDDTGSSSQAGYEDDTPGIFLPLPSQQSSNKLGKDKQEHMPKDQTSTETKYSSKEKRRRAVQELRKYKMGTEDTTSSGGETTEGDGDTVVYYYINEDIVTNENESNEGAQDETGPGDTPPENTVSVPLVVYDEDGNAVSVSDLHDAGHEVYMEHPKVPPPEVPKVPPPPPVEESDVSIEVDEESSESSEPESKSSNATSTTSSAETSRQMNAASEFNDSMPQAQDQMIIISTVATMALLVGALSARRMRSRQFLSSCIENESLEDDVAYDAAYTHPAASRGSMAGGFGHHPQLHHRGRGVSNSLMAGGAVGYDTFGSTSDNPPPWKGDLEKFDV